MTLQGNNDFCLRQTGRGLISYFKIQRRHQWKVQRNPGRDQTSRGPVARRKRHASASPVRRTEGMLGGPAHTRPISHFGFCSGTLGGPSNEMRRDHLHPKGRVPLPKPGTMPQAGSPLPDGRLMACGDGRVLPNTPSTGSSVRCDTERLPRQCNVK